ncbi:Large ribosomal subunit protein bL12m [Exophiala dermatitidis]
MSVQAPSATYRCCRLATQIQKRSLSSQCLRISSTSSLNQQRRRTSPTQSLKSRRWQSTEAAAAENPKIASIVDQISQLTLLETADLVASLKVCSDQNLCHNVAFCLYYASVNVANAFIHELNVSQQSRLNIPDMAFAAPAAAPGAGSAAAAAPAEEEEAAPAPAEKTMFTLKLESFDATAKPKIIKEVKSMLGLSLVDSKKFVESAPKVLKESVPKEDAEKIVAAMKALGAVVKME